MAIGLLMAPTAFAAEVTVQTVAGPSPAGPLQRLTENGSLRLGGEKPVDVAGADLMGFRRLDVPLPPPPDGPQLVLVNGDRVAGEFLGFAADRVRFRLPTRLAMQREVVLPPTVVSVIWLGDLETGESGAKFRRRLAAQQRPRDALLLRNGDAVEGVLLAANADTIEVEVNRKPLQVPRGRVAAIAFSTDLAADLKPKGPYFRAVFADGSRLSLTRPACDGTTFSAATLIDVPLRVALTDVVSVGVHQGPAVYLSDVKPLREERQDVSPNLPWPTVRDGNADGQELRLGGGVFDKGLGMHGACQQTFDVSGGYRRFQALVGLDDVAGKIGSVRVRVLVDGQPVDVGLDRELTHADGAIAVRVPLKGARELTLVVDLGRRLDVGDHVNWAEAMLVK